MWKLWRKWVPLIIISNFVPSEATVGISKENVSDFYEYFKTERNFTPSFQTIKGPDGIIIFSAFLINSGELHSKTDKVIIIGFEKRISFKSQVYCEFNEEVVGGGRSQASRLYAADKNKSVEYCSVIFECNVPPEVTNPNFVSLVNLEKNSGKILEGRVTDNSGRIRYPPPTRQPKFKVAACIKPFYTETWTDTNPSGLIEWIEFQRMMGVEHFTFYNISGPPEFRKVLESYGDEISLLPWDIPFKSGRAVASRGQYGQTNDCLYRYKGVARFVSTLDYDEFLIPRDPTINNYAKLFSRILLRKRLHGLKVFELKFKAFFSFTNWIPREEAGKLKMMSMTQFLPSNQTKFIQIEENLKVAGVHKGTLGVPGSVSYNVPESIGYYLHYRGCTEFFLKENPTLLNGANCLNNYSSRVQNTDARNRFGPQLESRVNRKVTMLVELGHVDKKWLKTFSIIKK